MFTGIIESLGTVKNIVRASHSFSIEIQSDFNEKLMLGESIAVNGVCLTVAEFSGSVFKADVTPETFSRTSLKILRPGIKSKLQYLHPRISSLIKEFKNSFIQCAQIFGNNIFFA